MTNNNRFEDVNNSTTTNNEETKMFNKFFEDMDEYFNSLNPVDYEKQDLYTMAGYYTDAELKIEEDESGKMKAVISFTPEEEAEDWKRGYIQDFAAEEDELAEKALTSEKEADIFAEIINEEYNEYCDPTASFYASVDEIKQKLSGKNIKIIIENTDDVFVELISSQDIQSWREGVLQDRDEDY